MKKESKILGGRVTETKQENQAGVEIGFISGYIATWDVDRGDFWGQRDQFVMGAFAKSIIDHRNRARKIRFKDHHGRTIGGFPINTVIEDRTGLFGTAEVNLDVQQGREAYSLAKQGVLTDFSIGFSADDYTIDKDIRTITQATIWEGSIVDEPMNPAANVTEIKAVVPFQDLPLADREREWDAAAAVTRVRQFLDATEEPNDRYKNAFLWYDREDSDNFGAYKLPIADVVDDKLVAVPRGVIAAAAAMRGARGGVMIPEADRPGVIRHIERYYAKMDMPSPFEDDDKQYFVIADVKDINVRDLERILRKSGCFSKSAAKLLAGQMGAKFDESQTMNNTKSIQKMLDDLNAITGALTSS